MRTIPISYNKDGFNHLLMHRDGDVAIYEKRKNHIDPTPDFVRYEVVIIRKYTRDNDFHHVKVGDEYLPCTNDWGRYGWTYVTLQEAKEKMSKIILEKEKKT